MPCLDSISFDTSGLEHQSDRDCVRVWHTECGDGVGLYWCALPPDIEADLESIEEVRDFYRKACASAGQAIIEVDTLTVDDCPAVRTMVKVPQQPSGMTYVGAITLPFRDFSYVVKVQCPEAGTTGVRDAIILDRMLAAGRVRIGESGKMVGWML
jgi:hypothetical protein